MFLINILDMFNLLDIFLFEKRDMNYVIKKYYGTVAVREKKF